MAAYSDTNISIICQKCKKDLSARLSNILNSGILRCSSCGSEVRFNSSAISNIKYAIRDQDNIAREIEQIKRIYERTKNEFEKAKKELEKGKAQLDIKVKQQELAKTKLSELISRIKDGMQFKIKV